MSSAKKKPVWKCPKGCELTAKPCKHLEAQLPKMRAFRSVKHIATDEIEKYSSPVDERDPIAAEVEGSEIDKFAAKLQALGLPDNLISLAIDKYGYGFTLREIREAEGWSSQSGIEYHYRVLRRFLAKHWEKK